MSYAPITVIDSYVSYLNNTAQKLTNIKNQLYDEYTDNNSDTDTDTDNIFNIVNQNLEIKYNEMLPDITNQIEIFQGRTINQLYNFLLLNKIL